MAAIQGAWPQYHLLLLWIIFMAMPVTPEMVYRVDPLGNKINILIFKVHIHKTHPHP